MSIRLRRHYPLLLAPALIVGALLLCVPGARIVAYTVAGPIDPPEYTIDYGSDIDLFDDMVVHEVVVLISEKDREQMVTTYRETGGKDYVPADVIIDGVRVNEVGIRLKGNASLRALGGRGGGRMPGFPGGGSLRDRPPFEGRGSPAPPGNEDLPAPGEEGRVPGLPGNWDFPMPGGLMPPGAGGGTSKVSYLIRFDEYVEGQRYQGRTQIALRASGVSYDAAQLQEPVSNYIMNRVGVSSAATAYISLQFNEDDAQLYVVAEEIDQVYIDRLFPGSEGVLYKVQQVGNNFAYLGPDPALYEGAFSQETARNDADFAPLIDLIRFVNEASDEEFARDLPAWLDVDAFAAYLAVNNLLMNHDSLAGMGNNYYLYYDQGEDRFTILAWDTNESLGKMSMGGGTTMDLYWQAVGSDFGRLFGDDAGTAEQTTNVRPRVPQRGWMGRGGNHLLMTRFMATPTYLALYEEKLETFYQRIYVEGMLADQIAEYVALVTAYNEGHGLVSQTDYDAAVQRTLSMVDQRAAFLRTTALLGE